MQKKDWPKFNKNLISKVGQVIRSGKINYISGSYGKIFEKNFSKFIGNKYSIAICNGTAALEVAIKSLGLPKKSEIIVPARSFFSSAACIVNTGYTPIFADVDLIKQNISLDDIKKKITSRTRAIICVHLAGLPCDMININKLAKKNKLKIIEDCSQAHGASINGKQVGSFGDVATWSFCNDKIISTLGEGGMISTNNKKIYQFSIKYINHGTTPQKKNSNIFLYNKDIFGTNLRITEIQSMSGIEQLKNLKKIQKRREEMAKNYFKLISRYGTKLNSYMPPKNIKSAWYRFYFFINPKIKNLHALRIKIIRNLKKNGIRCFTGSCPEIYLEKSFRKLKNVKFKRLKNCKELGYTSLALDANHTLAQTNHKKELYILKSILDKFFSK